MLNWFMCLIVPWNLLAFNSASAAAFKIKVIDEENGWPVPLVELTSTHNVSFITDNAGVVAIDLPELMGREIWLSVRSDGYEVPADGFGYRGFRTTPMEGQTHIAKVSRTSIAKRLGRLTGAGIFSESQKLGEHLDWKESGVFGCDSIQMATHNGKKFWSWGDSILPQYPLGIFHMTSATTPVRPLNKFEPPIAIPLNYFRDNQGRPRGIAEIAGDGPTWLGGYVSLPDATGKYHLVATYSKIRGMLHAYRLGQCIWDEKTQKFASSKVLWDQSKQHPKPPTVPDGHPCFWTDDDGARWVFFGNPFPTIRMPATFEAWQDSSQWQILKPQAVLKSSTEGKRVKVHRGSIAWNAFRKKWVSVFTQIHGKPSPLGEIWYAEADHPTGPWGPAIKILSHAEYTFYNPRLHADFTPDGSPILLFEGTYASTFSKAQNKKPRYDYNQVLYRLDLDDPKLLPLTK